MRKRQIYQLLLFVLLFSFMAELWINKLQLLGRMERLGEETVTKMEFRDQQVGEQMIRKFDESQSRGLQAGIYLLESKFGYQRFPYPYTKQTFQREKEKWEKKKAWDTYLKINQAIWDDVKYFPVPESRTDKEASVAFENGWMKERNYGGKRGHEGTDLMASKNVAGYYPVISMTDGVVQSKGWLEKGGYRVGILAPLGGYFYYAHLDSYADIEEGDSVKAGDVLGFMGDSGYGSEGTTGKFPVHLHIGIYVYPGGQEMSVNPYWVLRYLEGHKLKCAYSD